MSDTKGKQRLEMEAVAKWLKVSGDIDKLTNKQLFEAIKRVSGKTYAESKTAYDDAQKKPTVVEAKTVDSNSKEAVAVAGETKVEVMPANSAQRVEVAAPVIHMNVPAPVVNVGSREAPRWFDVVGKVKDAVLYMVAGAAGYALVHAMMLRPALDVAKAALYP